MLVAREGIKKKSSGDYHTLTTFSDFNALKVVQHSNNIL